MATYSSILAWRIPWTEELSWLQLIGLQRVRTERFLQHTHALSLPRSGRIRGGLENSSLCVP